MLLKMTMNFCSKAVLSRWDYRHPPPMPSPILLLQMFQRKHSKKHSHKDQRLKEQLVIHPLKFLLVTLSVQNYRCSSFLIDQISLDKRRNHCQDCLIPPLMMGTPDTNGWGKKKVNSHQAPLLNTDTGPNLGLDLCQSTSKAVMFLDQFCQGETRIWIPNSCGVFHPGSLINIRLLGLQPTQGYSVHLRFTPGR